MSDLSKDIKDIEKGTYYTDKKLKNIKVNSFLNGMLIASVVFSIIICLITFSLYLIINRYGEIGKDKNVSKLMTILNLYDKYYVNDIDIEEMVDSAIYSIASVSGDKYSLYVPSSQANTTAKQRIEGTYKGVGISYLKFEDYLEIVSIIKDSPAGRSNLKIGDKITHINGEIVSEKVENNFSNGIKNSTLKRVVFTINGEEEVELVVGDVNSPILDYEIEGKVGYISIHQFIGKTFESFKVAIDDMVNKGVETIVFDLRDNGGGELVTVSKMLDYILEEKDSIVKVKYVSGEEEVINFEDGRSISSNIKLKLVCNNNTASASELFIMTLQDYRNAELYGVKTFGKSTVGKMFMFKDGSMINISTGIYYPKSERNIEGIGIMPDVVLNEEDILKDVSELYAEGKLNKN